ncbi:hypothetical protein HDU67_002740 [Dinochytrium kinnereticum]|nr:hypothetical protein HDU67_002740 [Dinochytrium kinnereticum]
MKQQSTLGCSFIAFAVLVCVQVTIGVIYKLAGASGGYKFSAASSLAISEFVKLLLSYGLLVATLGPTIFPVGKPAPKIRKDDDVDLEDLSADAAGKESLLGGSSSSSSSSSSPDAYKTLGERWVMANSIVASSFQMSVLVPIGGLAGLYAFNNHFAFWLYLMVDPGTISLVKSASTFISAYILWVVFGRTTNRLQWMAIILQAMGIVGSQYDPCTGGTMHPLASYALLFISVTITALAGCVNDHITKTMKLPLHAINIYLYLFGFIFNLLFYFLGQYSGDSKVGFFDGYDAIAVMVVFCNCVIGLVITAVYKYADAVVKTMAQTISTGILLVLSALVFSSPFGVLQGCGVIVIFVSVYLYFVCSTSQLAMALHEYITGSKNPADPAAGFSLKRLIFGGLVALVTLGGLINVYWTGMDTMTPTKNKPKPIDPRPLNGTSPDFIGLELNRTVTDFYKDVLVVVNWNNPRYDPNYWHWRDIYPRELFPHVIHYGPNDDALKEFTAGQDDEVRVDERVHANFPGSFGYESLLRGLQEANLNAFKGILWTNFDVFLRVDRLTRFDKDRMWFTDKIEYMPFSADGTHRVAEISHGWSEWFVNGMGFNAARAVVTKLPRKEQERFLELHQLSEPVIPFAKTLSWQVPFRDVVDGTNQFGTASDAMYIPTRCAGKAIEFARAANSSDLFLEFALPWLSEWLKMSCEIDPWVDTWGHVPVDSVAEAERIGQVVDVYHSIDMRREVDARKWRKYVAKFYSV